MFNRRLLSIIVLFCLLLLSASHAFARRSKYRQNSGRLLASNKVVRRDKKVDNQPSTSLDLLRADLDEILQGLSGFDGIEGSERDFVLGYAEFKRGKWKESDAFFKIVQGDLPLIGDHILYYRAVIANNLGRGEEAVDLLDKLSKEYPGSVWTREAVFELARALVILGHNVAAQKEIKKYKKTARDHQLFEADLLMAKSLVESGSGAAVTNLKDLIMHSGSEDELDELRPLMADVKKRFKANLDKWLGNPYRQYQLAQSFAERSQWDEAAGRLEGVLRMKNLDFATKVRTKWLLSRAYRWLHRYDESIALMKELQKTHGAREYARALSWNLATVYAKRDEYDKAIAVREQMLKGRSPKSRSSANIAYKIAYLYMDEGKYNKALEMWRRVLRMNNGPKQRVLSRWNLAWCYYMLGRYDDAIAVIDVLLKREARRMKIKDRVTYWKARMLKRQEKGAEADTLFKEIIKKYPNGYYAVLAKRQLDGDVRTVDSFIRYKNLHRRLSKWHPDELQRGTGSIHMDRAILFDKMGLREEAKRELKAIDLKKHFDKADQIMWYAHRNHAYNLAMRMARYNYKGMLKNSPSSSVICRFIWEQYYPEAYRAVVNELARKSDVDNILVWSIMRNESAFKPEVVSPAGAVGLMQLMPTTANKMVDENGGGKIDRRKHYHPATKKSLGIQYQKKQRRIFPGNPVAVIASYNAGEEAVGRWIGNGPVNDIEEWIEEIPYSETNLYVKKVLASYWNYKKLY